MSYKPRVNNKSQASNRLEDLAAVRAAAHLYNYASSWQQWLDEGKWSERASEIIAAQNDLVWGKAVRTLRIVRARLLEESYGNAAIMQALNIAIASFNAQPGTTCSEKEAPSVPRFQVGNHNGLRKDN